MCLCELKNITMNQIRIFLTAIMFYTRIPIPKIKDYNNGMLSKSTRYFPLIGLIVGVLTALVYFGFSKILPSEIAILLSMAFSVYLTGAFHEDGFADFCDGFGGGYTKEKVLTIMKDSRIGTYGSVGLIFMLATKFLALNALNTSLLIGIIIAGHTFSRIIPVALIYITQYVREDETSKSKPIGHRGSYLALFFAIITGLVPVIWIGWFAALIFSIAILFVTLIFKRYIVKKIGGYTGDVLGALQQITEVVFYLCILVLQNNEAWNLF